MGKFKLTSEEEKEIISAIQIAEKQTSGEIRVHISNLKTKDYFKAAEKIFHKIKMHETQNRNGVLFFVSPKNRVFTIIGDKGINDIVGAEFWNSIKDKVIEEFKNQNYVQGFLVGIEEIGKVLKEHFPAQTDNTNELPDEISWD